MIFSELLVSCSSHRCPCASTFLFFFFFFFKQKTAYEMRISDWSSDVCSSDLSVGAKDRPRPSGRLSGVRARHPVQPGAPRRGERSDRGPLRRAARVRRLHRISGEHARRGGSSATRAIDDDRGEATVGREGRRTGLYCLRQIGSAACRERGGKTVELPVVAIY